MSANHWVCSLDRFQQPKQPSNLFNPFQVGQKLKVPILPGRSPLCAVEDCVPEILIVGATGRLGRLLVRQLLLYQPMSKWPKVRILVRNLYTRTLDILGTGVTYCQGDLQKMETLEDAVTDVDKLIFCARCDDDDEAELLNNLLAAYQNIRHADYGTSQAAKRSLFKFTEGNRDDVSLLAIEEEEDVTAISPAASPDSESVEEEHFLLTSSTISLEYCARYPRRRLQGERASLR
jgi:NmrA-like family